MNAVRLHPAPGVAHYVLRFDSESTPGLTYDTALMVGEPGQRAYWECSCPSGIYRDVCKHIRAAERRLAALRSVARFTRRSA